MGSKANAWVSRVLPPTKAFRKLVGVARSWFLLFAIPNKNNRTYICFGVCYDFQHMPGMEIQLSFFYIT